jgi:hypothetical protein
MNRSSVATVALAAVLVGLTSSAPARAFEREWPRGAGAGVAALTTQGGNPGLEAGAHLAYGLSDVFDLRLDGRYAWLPLRLEATYTHPPLAEMRTFAWVDASLAYKVDVLRAVPWLAGGVGYFHAFEAPLPEQSLWSNDVHLFGAVGLDYALTREVGLGGTARYGLLLGGSADFGAQAYVEYRWGF